MQLINGTYQSGHVRLAGPVDWPEGAEVEVQLSNQPIGLTEESWPHETEAIEKLLKSWERIEPLVLTDDERSDFAATRKHLGKLSMSKLDARVGES